MGAIRGNDHLKNPDVGTIDRLQQSVKALNDHIEKSLVPRCEQMEILIMHLTVLLKEIKAGRRSEIQSYTAQKALDLIAQTHFLK